MSITYNTQVNTQALDSYLDPGIDTNIILNNLQYLKQDKNLVEVDCPDIYKYRPDRIAYQYYGDCNFFPLVLAANNLGSLLQFVPSRFGNKIKLIKSQVIKNLLKI
jgi:hypothetical protein